ncbi:ENTH domain [Musa troglodytarum]|uniref:ENTH domain n=1 Tax=Musa troglodytarum TaxID=320322 RepID=A0A9E7G122_9LILI|nr:ENTH domain [Musa troglodytarum]
MMSRCMRRKAKREVCADLVSVLQEDDDIPKEPSERDLGTQKSCPSHLRQGIAVALEGKPHGEPSPPQHHTLIPSLLPRSLAIMISYFELRYRVGLISVMLLRQSHWSKHSRWTFSGEVSTRTMDEAACNWEHRPQMETCQGGKSNKLTRRSCGGSNKIVFLLCFITNVEFLVHEDGEHMMNDNEGYQAK